MEEFFEEMDEEGEFIEFLEEFQKKAEKVFSEQKARDFIYRQERALLRNYMLTHSYEIPFN